MAACMTLAQFKIESIGDFLVYPTSCDYYFYAKVFVGLFLVLILSIYYGEQRVNLKPDMISAMGVSSLAIFFLSLIGTLVKSTAGIPMIQQDIFIYVFSFTIVFLGIWFFKD